ncbi:MAG: bifunctional folylpolyglutamate synthase/dihydrofolate synthase [Deltaproteobacteria bacterium]|nr:bifunctional folylpolyglutamate synthase/dihydrofolate synthase [Deltaproteobacteria bacterium]
MSRNNLTYPEALERLYSLQKFGIKFGLSKTSNLLRAFGDPHRGRRFVHIAGTNGKGSVASMVGSMLERSGLKVGLYSSPHLVRFTERFCINGREMSRETAAGLAGELMAVVDPREPPTFFEIVTAMALVHFAREEVDVALMEVGMGGRLDATNVIDPLVTVITNISLEHQDYLGRRLEDIAGEKAGIVKPGVPLVTGVTQPPVIRRVERACRENKAPMIRLGRDVRYRYTSGGLSYTGTTLRLRGLHVGLPGGFQGRNAALALAVMEVLAAKGVPASEDQIREGLARVSWPGRMQLVAQDPAVVVDGGHNPRALRAVAAALPRAFSFRRLILVIGVMADKDIPAVLKEIVPLSDYVIYTRPAYARSADPETLERAAAPLGKAGEIAPTLAQALDRAMKIADVEDLIFVSGSLFTAGEALSLLDPERYRPDEI